LYVAPNKFGGVSGTFSGTLWHCGAFGHLGVEDTVQTDQLRELGEWKSRPGRFYCRQHVRHVGLRLSIAAS